MAIEVIKHGKQIFKAICPICGCEFTYQSEDLKEDCFHNHYVECPDCKHAVSHEYEPKKRSLQDDLTWKFPKPGEPIPVINKKEVDKNKWFYIDYPSPQINNWPDCETCPNKPDPMHLIVSDTPCTWCVKNKPYCFTGDKFPPDYTGGICQTNINEQKIDYTIKEDK